VKTPITIDVVTTIRWRAMMATTEVHKVLGGERWQSSVLL